MRRSVQPVATEDDGTSVVSLALRVLLLLGLVGVIVGMAYLRTFPPMATVMSESMSPDIAVGDIVLFTSLGGDAPAVGDVVEVKVSKEFREKFDYPSVVIHRVIGIEDDG